MILRILILFLYSFSFISIADNNSNEVIATVGSHEIFLNEFTARYSKSIPGTGFKDNLLARNAILNNMINEILLKNYDDNNEIFNNEEFQKELEWTKNQAVLAYLKDQEIYAEITASEEEVRQAFLRLNQKIAARHLYTKTENEANHLYQLLSSGVSFDSLASTVFTDSILKNNGGFLGYFTWGDMDPAFEDAAFSLKVGEISKPVKTEFGYSIITIDDIITTPLITETQFLQKKSQIERAVRINKKRTTEKNYINKLVDVDAIIFNEEVLQKYFSSVHLKTDEEIIFPADQICAELNGVPFMSSYLNSKFEILPKNIKEKITTLEDFIAAFKGFIIQDELLKAARGKRYDKNLRVLEAFSKMRSNLFYLYKKDEIYSKSEVFENDALDFYYKNIHLFTSEPEIEFAKVFVKDESIADSIIYKMNYGSNFNEVVDEFAAYKITLNDFDDFGNSKLSSIKNQLLKYEAGDVIGPIQMDNYFGIFQILEKRNGHPIDFEIVKNEVVKLAREEKGKEIMENYLRNLRKKVKIEINNLLLTNAEIEYAG